MTSTLTRAAILASVVLAGAVPALAQAQSSRPPAELTIINARTVALTQFEIATSGDNPRLVGRLQRPLAPGQQVKLRLTRPTGCAYFVLARFEDESENDSDGLNLCGEKQIRLTD